MDLTYLTSLNTELREKGIEFAPGLTDKEVAEVEAKYGFRFPPDLKAFLQFALPISNNFPDWRNDSDEKLWDKLNWPLEGICFDIEHNVFWWEDWGEKPTILADAFEIARKEIAKAPILIPIYGHRYLPAEPSIDGNPVFSVCQTDIIYYGNDLASYFANEFNFTCPVWAADAPRPIKFWSELVW